MKKLPVTWWLFSVAGCAIPILLMLFPPGPVKYKWAFYGGLSAVAVGEFLLMAFIRRRHHRQMKELDELRKQLNKY